MFYITLNIEGVDEEEEEEEEEEEGGERREIDSVQHVGSVERVESGPNLRPWRKKKKTLSFIVVRWGWKRSGDKDFNECFVGGGGMK